MRRVAIALVHHPVVDAQGATVTTAITNLDVHDLARSARSFGVGDYFIVHPIAAQRELVERICAHWADGSSGRRIPDRKLALALVRVVDSLDAAIAAMGGRDAVDVWVTAARDVAPPMTYADARAAIEIEGEGKAILIVFGTGWGLARSVIDGANATLEPVRAARAGYNHLSVRAACAIILDRLFGAAR